MTRETRPWDAAEFLKTKDEIIAYLDAILEDGDPVLLKAALGDVARAKGMTEIARAAGLGRANLYKALSPDGNPELATVAKVLRALGLRFTVTTAAAPRRTRSRKPSSKPTRKSASQSAARSRRGAR
ncbi:MAG: putative addiction module antidote protein [Alphaproteobacteria bacterium]|nr:putative addiction module antidote protein [Alphaproteobacteria bacterium]